MTLGELSKKMLVSCGNTTVVVDNLEADGYLKRTHSKDDRRVVFVDLTAKGKRFFRTIFVKHAAFVGRIAEVLSEEEQAELGRLVKKLGLGLSAFAAGARDAA